VNVFVCSGKFLRLQEEQLSECVLKIDGFQFCVLLALLDYGLVEGCGEDIDGSGRCQEWSLSYVKGVLSGGVGVSELVLGLGPVADALWSGDKRNVLQLRGAVVNLRLFDGEVERWGGNDRHSSLWVEKVVGEGVVDVLSWH